MKKHKAFLLFMTLLVLLPGKLLAGDYAALNFIGFSKDGKYLAFEEYGTQDGSGFPYSNFYFVDVQKNSFVGKPFTFRIDNETATEAATRKKARLAVAKRLQALKIVQGNTGKHIVSRLITDLAETDTFKFAEEIGSFWHKGDYTLTLKKTEIKTTDCEVYELPTHLLNLTLKDNEGDKTFVLQKDETLPKSRGCALDYRVQEIFMYEGRIAVFINVFTPGFEGQDMSFMVVTGELK
jgi:predicted secreted protein